ncbi:MAG TPA: hypothetical protein VM221_12860 [Armatimonadota bacterium]|nr:hypothetical protein [Armatimonadota bacterium]
MNAESELAAMKTVHGALSELDEGARTRVLRWAAEVCRVDLQNESVVRSAAEEPCSVRDMADLYHAVNPETDAERALVAAYWHQVEQEQEQDGFDALSVNKTLKNLGHRVRNITDALGSLMERRPALVIQVRKRGTTKQGRKRYRLSQAGITAVRERLTGEPALENQGER